MLKLTNVIKSYTKDLLALNTDKNKTVLRKTIEGNKGFLFGEVKETTCESELMNETKKLMESRKLFFQISQS